MYSIQESIVLPMSKEVCWAFFSNPYNLNKLTPPDLHFHILGGAEQSMYPGQLISYEVQPFKGYNTSWLTEIKHVVEYKQFVDEQRLGPYSLWYHLHEFIEVEGGMEVRDTVHYSLPFAWIGQMAHWLFVRKRLVRIFKYRSRVLTELFTESYAANKG